MLSFTTKAEARRHFAQLRAALRPELKANKDAALAAHILSLPEYEQADILLCYYPIKGEPDLRPLMQAAMEAGKKVALPTVDEGVMTFRRFTGELSPGAFGIPEPTGEEVSPTPHTLCILPGYGYDGSFRLGYGGGYYDRFLEGFPGTAIGAYYHDFTAHFPHDRHDIPARLIITEKGKL